MDCTSIVRSRSAGRVERSLKLPRKKEVEGEIPRRNSTGTEIVVNSKYCIYQNFSIVIVLNLNSNYVHLAMDLTTDLVLACDSYETCKYIYLICVSG